MWYDYIFISLHEKKLPILNSQYEFCKQTNINTLIQTHVNNKCLKLINYYHRRFFTCKINKTLR